MVYTSDIQLSTINIEKPSLFLAGSMDIKGQTNWRERATEQFQAYYHIFDPTHTNHSNLNDTEMSKHIKWEWEALNRSDLILLNFTAQAKSPMSLLELGMYISSGKIVVVCPKEFYQAHYINTLCTEHKVPIFESIDDILQTDIFQLTKN